MITEVQNKCIENTLDLTKDLFRFARLDNTYVRYETDNFTSTFFYTKKMFKSLLETLKEFNVKIITTIRPDTGIRYKNNNRRLV